MARKAFVVTDAMREQVLHLAGVGLPQNDIATVIGCSPKTLRKCLRAELDRGVAEANATVAGHLFASVKRGNVAAQIFWLKTRANWREQKADDPVAATEAGSQSEVVLILPDNIRDPELTQALSDAQRKYFAGKRRRSP